MGLQDFIVEFVKVILGHMYTSIRAVTYGYWIRQMPQSAQAINPIMEERRMELKGPSMKTPQMCKLLPAM